MTKVVVAMSGGVDSSVAAALLKQEGHEVIGVMLRLWSEPGKEDSNRCCTPDAMAIARRVAARLEIPFYAVDARQVFYDEVISYFLTGYSLGITPNPCLACNRLVRWDLLMKHAQALGAEYLATGHYARLEMDAGSGKVKLFRALDRTKDQSYVLHVLNQDQLAHTLLPVGAFEKQQVRALAEQFGLPSASRPDSQDLCFLAGEDYRAFLQRHAPQSLQAGPIVDESGKQVGTHRGLAAYTIGQRKGLGLSTPEPMYVLDKQVAVNTLVVGPQSLQGNLGLVADQVKWISGSPPADQVRAEVKIRYTARETPASVQVLGDGKISIRFDHPQRDVTPGQAAVLYDGDLLLGGGTIERAF